MHTVIFANGDFSFDSVAANAIQQAKLIISADGGANHCASLEITPDILIGDCDSIDHNLLTNYLESGVTIQRHPKEKNATDLELALDYASRKGASSIDVLGTLGGRWDMSLANILLMANQKYSGIKITLIAEHCRILLLHPGIHHIEGTMGQCISLLPIKGDASAVKLNGFRYPLDRQTIYFGSSLGVSNVMTGDHGVIEHSAGILLCIYQNS